MLGSHAMTKDPLVAFVLAALKGTVAGVIVYFLIYGSGVLFDAIAAAHPLKQPAALEFWRTFFDWTGAVSAAGSFAMITLVDWYRIARLALAHHDRGNT
jgi:hypothetical protein